MKGTNVKLYGPVQIGHNAIIEDNVVIGHPSVFEINAGASSRGDFEQTDAFYNYVTKTPTIIGDNAIIRSGSIIYSGVTIGDNFDCGHHVIVREGSFIGSNVYFKSHSHIMRNVHIGDSCRVAAVVADNSIVGRHVSVFGTLTHRHPKRSPQDTGPWIGPTVKDGCLIGRGSIVLGPIEIGENSIVGANAIVNFEVPAGCLVVGPKAQIVHTGP